MTAVWLDWLTQSSIALCILIPIAWLCSQLLRRTCGARAGYAAWLIVLPALLPRLDTLATQELLSTIIATPYSSAGWAMPDISTPTPNADGLGIFTLWLMGAVLALAFFSFRQWQFNRIVQAQLDPNAPVDVNKLRQAGIPSWVPVRVSHAIRSPMVIGCLPPRLCLPAGEMPARAILIHEASHLRHGDPLSSALITGLRSLFWFHPLVHFMDYRMRRDQELAADERALAHLGNNLRNDYAQLLCQTSGLLNPPLGHAWPGHSPLKERIGMLTHKPRSRKSVITGLTIVAMTTLLAGWGVIQAQERPAATDPQTDESRAAYEADLKSQLMKLVDSEPLEDDTFEPIVRVNPRYPKAAADAGITGHVVMDAVLTENGAVSSIRVVESDPEGVFDAEAVQAFSQWRVAPFRDSETGLPQQRKIRQRIEFELDTSDLDNGS